jgi:outer membrane protein OmpA-like peptidoglycan-associated protein
VFRATYEGFGKVVQQQYPEIMPEFPPVNEAVNLRFLQELQSKNSKAEEGAEVVEFTEPSGPTAKENIVAQKNWNIQFETGSATFNSSALRELENLYNQLAVGGALTIEIQGHTDNVGNPASNQTLSERRASAVKQWMETRSTTLFPANRTTVSGYGDTKPVASNTSTDGKARNRRVTIILGTKG